MVRSIGQYDVAVSQSAVGSRHVPSPPKLVPNVYARLARWCMNHAKMVLAFWLVISCLAATAATWIYQAPKSYGLPFPEFNKVQSASIENFAKLSRIQTLSITQADPHELSIAREQIYAALLQRTDLVEMVLAPGAGNYYDDHNLLYRPLIEVQSRVAYALSLKPLFDAVKRAPDAASMATLLSGIAGTVAQGKDPQGLDDLLAEAAVAVQAMNVNEDHPLDWAKIADLEFESTNTKSIITILPQEGKQAESEAYVLSLAKAAGVDAQVSGARADGDNKNNQTLLFPMEKTRLIAALLIGFVFATLLLAIALGRVVIICVITAPVLFMAPISILAVFLVGAGSWVAYWPVFVFGLLLAASLTLNLILEAASLSPQLVSDETAMMLAAHYHGRRLLWRGLLLAIPFAGLALLPQPAGPLIVLAVVMLTLSSFAICFTLAPALTKIFEGALDWRAANWWGPAHRSLFETGQWQFVSRGLGILLVVACVASIMASTRKTEPNETVPVSVALIAKDKDEALELIEKLRGVPSAAAVQWLGSFLAEQPQEKQQELQRLLGQFPRIEPVALNNPGDVRDVVETMQDSLRQIAQAANARQSLKQSAIAFRQSLAVLAATTEDKKLTELNNRLFGGFNRLSDRADSLAGLTPPTLETLPLELHTLFGSAPGPYRLVVAPIAAVPPSQLAATLDQLNFPVLHPSVLSSKLEASRYAVLMRVFVLAAALTMVISIFVSSGITSYLLTLLVGVAACFILAASQLLWSQNWNLQWLLSLCLLIGWLSTNLVVAAPNQRATLNSAVNVLLIPCLMLIAAIPLNLLGMTAAANQILPFVVSMLAISVVIGLFERHGPATEEY